jgi:hypothetical protein
LIGEAVVNHKVAARKVPRRSPLRSRSAVLGSPPYDEVLPN